MQSLFSSTYPVACHTKNIGPGSTFVAIRGASHDGASYICTAIEKGAQKVVIESGAQLPQDAVRAMKENNVELLKVSNTRLALAQLSAQAAGNPAKKLKIIGITGTKGKTTTAFLLHHILKESGKRVALLSTVHNQIGDTVEKSSLTTMQPDYLHQFFAQCVQQDIEYVVMEVAAQAFTLHRVAGIEFDGAIFTNFASEHLEFYDSIDDYFQAKCELFSQCKDDAIILINSDNDWLSQLKISNAHTFGLGKRNEYQARVTQSSINGLQMNLYTEHSEQSFVCPTLFGEFNAYNVLAAVAMAHNCMVSMYHASQALTTFAGVRGRLEKYDLPNGAIAIIDYAHTPDSYEAILSALRTQTNHLIAIFGPAGNRDATKRPLMGAVAAQYADTIILSTDNPRDEDPQSIAHDVCAGIPDTFKNIVIEFDRKKAIQLAYAQSQKGTIIALLGKGPDEYQIVRGVKIPFSEKGIIQSF